MIILVCLLLGISIVYSIQANPLVTGLKEKSGDNNNSKIRYYEFNITTSPSWNPDCSNYTSTTTLLINGQMPGPTIYASKNDRVQILVRNMLSPSSSRPNPNVLLYGGGNTNMLSIHWHGIRQFGTNEMDGVPFLTQDPISYGNDYLYDFITDVPGTFFYHAHVGLQESSIFGPIVIYETDDANPEKRKRKEKKNKKKQQLLSLTIGNQTVTYHEDRTFILSEWHHQDRNAFEAYFLGPNFTAIPDAESVMVNGRTVNNEQLIVSNKKHRCQGYMVFPVQSKKTYRFRVISSSTFRTYGFAITDHILTIIEADGSLIDPYVTDYLEVAPGQRYSVLVTMDQMEKQKKRRDYPIGTIRMWGGGIDPTSNGWALLRYQDNDDKDKKMKSFNPVLEIKRTNSLFPNTNQPYWLWNQLKPAGRIPDAVATLPSPNRTLIINITNGPTSNFQTNSRFFINGVTYTEPEETILTQIMQGTRRVSPLTIDQLDIYNGYDPYLGTYPLAHMEVVDFVLQNNRIAGTPCRPHPWHIHGYSHYFIAYGPGTYNKTLHKTIRNVPMPILKDTSLMYPDLGSVDENPPLPGDPFLGCGWIKIRLVADNPGIWASHCHNIIHMFMGMFFILEASTELI
ncbi:Cupredoxin [Cunninghamella echinulata]|nr:Cupredoxin [Cunninghamella echinulata]